jgi:hypothetical protein
MPSSAKMGSLRLKAVHKLPRHGTGSSMNPPPSFVDRPSASEIEAYYLSDESLPPTRRIAVAEFVRQHYLDGGTRVKFIARRRKVEKAIITALQHLNT